MRKEVEMLVYVLREWSWIGSEEERDWYERIIGKLVNSRKLNDGSDGYEDLLNGIDYLICEFSKVENNIVKNDRKRISGVLNGLYNLLYCNGRGIMKGSDKEFEIDYFEND